MFGQWAAELGCATSPGTNDLEAKAEIIRDHYETLMAIEKLPWRCATCKRVGDGKPDGGSTVTADEHPPSRWKRFKKAFDRAFRRAPN
jgi:hypothetical protein